MTGLTKGAKSYNLGFPAEVNCYGGDVIHDSIVHHIVPIGIVFCRETRRCRPKC